MKKRYINIILIIFFITEGSVFRYISPDYYGSDISIFPRLVLVSIIAIALFLSKRYAFILGLSFGLLNDIIYGNVLGVYMIGMGGVAYISSWLIQFIHPTFLVYLLIEFLGLVVFEIFIFLMLKLYKLVTIPFDFAILNMIIPTIIFNLVFAALIYVPALNIFNKETEE